MLCVVVKTQMLFVGSYWTYQWSCDDVNLNKQFCWDVLWTCWRICHACEFKKKKNLFIIGAEHQLIIGNILSKMEKPIYIYMPIYTYHCTDLSNWQFWCVTPRGRGIYFTYYWGYFVWYSIIFGDLFVKYEIKR